MTKLITLLFLLPLNIWITNEKPLNSKFEVEIKLKNSKVIFEAKNGFTFHQLSFNANRKVEINQSGMVLFDKKNKINCPSDFIMEYSKSKNTIHFKGIKGTNFKNVDLIFDENHSSYILTENGI
jgi:alpha-glucuronidase